MTQVLLPRVATPLVATRQIAEALPVVRRAILLRRRLHLVLLEELTFKETDIPHQLLGQGSQIMVAVQFLEPRNVGQRSPNSSLVPSSAGILPLA